MTIGSALYKLLIGPLELFFEVVFALANRVVPHPGLAIVALSLAMNFLVLPLYRRADAMQAEERDQANRMKPWVDHIRKTFKGDERFMMLQTYYRQNGYKQTDALKGSISLLLEIPFFIAAYRFLSGLQLLQGVSFGPIRDLGAPDALITLGGLTVNLLPILMTAINVISAAIYMKGFPLKSKIQMYGMALIFLVFLYSSPSGLVFYWTLNNVFSLLKNIFYKLKHPRMVLSALASLLGIGGAILVLFLRPLDSVRRQVMALVFFALLQLPLVLYLAGRNRPARPEPRLTKADGRIYTLASLFVALLTGALIPSAVIRSSPAEFVNVMAYRSPLWYIVSALLLAAGTFLIWFGIFYRLASPSGKKIMSCGMWAMAGIAAADYMFFGTNYGNLSTLLVYDTYPVNTAQQLLANLGAAALIVLVFALLWKRLPALVSALSLALCLAVAGMAGSNVAAVQSTLREIDRSIDAAQEMPRITLNKNGRNVMVLMMDRAISSYVPFLMQENPQLQEQFAGFTYYPNTIAFGQSTNFGTPPLYGGYEYTPEEMNKRDTELLVEKHNESLKVMPVLFDENGFDVTVCDPTYAGYQYVPDLSIYDPWPDIKAYITLGKFSVDSYEVSADVEAIRDRNFFCYSLTKIVPLIAQPTLYNQGLYNQADALASSGEGLENATNTVTQTEDGLSKATGLDEIFMNAYAVLTNLPAITQITDSDADTFLMFSNDTMHDLAMLKEPEYEPAAIIDNTVYDAEHYDRTSTDGRVIHLEDSWQVKTYQVDMAGMIQLGKWFDYLRENGVYDNTRIIIVSDHGWPLGHFENMIIGDGWGEDVMRYNPVLMVKDFGATELTTDMQFMTHADVPTLAMEGLIEDPVNPFTGKAINSDAKDTDSGHLVFWSPEWNIYDNHGTTFMPGTWYLVGDYIFDPNEWTMVLDEMPE